MTVGELKKIVAKRIYKPPYEFNMWNDTVFLGILVISLLYTFPIHLFHTDVSFQMTKNER